MYGSRYLSAGLAILLAAACAPSEESVEDSGVGNAVVVEGFSTPESVLHDTAADVYLVSNINGVPVEHDDNGFISRVAPSGEIRELRWIDAAREDVTLHAPKGMVIVGDTLFVTDIDTVRLFHRTSGEPLGSWDVPGSTFLNDLTASGDTVYVSDSGIRFGESGLEDTGSAAIYRFTDTGVPVLVEEAGDATKVNGIVAADGRLTVVSSFGSGAMYFLEEGERTELPGLPGNSLDGVIALSDGGLLVSDWDTDAVYLVPASGPARVVAADVADPADIGYDVVRNRVLIPLFNLDRVILHDL